MAASIAAWLGNCFEATDEAMARFELIDSVAVSKHLGSGRYRHGDVDLLHGLAVPNANQQEGPKP
jgi:hypothetical protein